MQRCLHILLIGAFFLSLSSCKKEVKEDPNYIGIDRSKTYLDNEPENKLKDDTWYFYKLLSLWQDQIPPLAAKDLNKIEQDNYLRENFTKYFRTADDVLKFLTGKTPTDQNSGKPIDRFSFLDRGGVVSGEIEGGVVTSYGMYVFYLQTAEAAQNNNNAYLYIRMVDVNSPAYNAGLRRGDRILTINGQGNYDYNSQLAQDFRGINNALNSSSMTIKWITPTGQEHTESIYNITYQFNPILSSRIIEQNGKKIGYLAFSSFVNLRDRTGNATMLGNFENIFNNFESAQPNALIVDLRYNGGGSVETAEYLIDRIIPASATGKLMYSYKVNNVLTRDWKWTKPDSVFAPVYVNKIGSLNVNTVYFLVTDGTASASELMINSLKPYMNVQIIGPEKTYGKPVGFFPIDIGLKDEVEVYVTSFQMFNSVGYGDYFGGLALNKQANEDYFKDFGDPEEALIGHALFHLNNGGYSILSLNKSASLRGDRFRATRMGKGINLGNRASDYGMYKPNNSRIRN